MNRNFPILLVEDNPDDLFFIQRAFQTAQINHPLFTVDDGHSAIEYLTGKGQYADRSVYPLPQLVITDLKMPQMTGFDLVEWMRQDFHCKLVPIIVLSSSGLARDINRAYALGANAFMVKPAEPGSLERLFRTIADFWMIGEKPQLTESCGQPKA